MTKRDRAWLSMIRRLAPAASLIWLWSMPAVAADGWQQAGSGAVAILPAPGKATWITGGSLVCAQQSWSFRLRTDPRPAPPARADATIVIGDEIYREPAAQTDTIITLPVSLDMLDAMQTGDRLGVSLGKDRNLPRALFSLRDSKRVIRAVTPRCGPVDMSAYDEVVLAQTDAATAIVGPLLADDIRQFDAATSAMATLAATQVDRPDRKSLLFATLCGSKWYYGRSGCTLIGFGRQDAHSQWQRVYDSEGMLVYLDPKASNGGWPNVVTLPMAGATAPMHWAFTGSVYELQDAIIAGDVPAIEGDAVAR